VESKHPPFTRPRKGILVLEPGTFLYSEVNPRLNSEVGAGGFILRSTLTARKSVQIHFLIFSCA